MPSSSKATQKSSGAKVRAKGSLSRVYKASRVKIRTKGSPLKVKKQPSGVKDRAKGSLSRVKKQSLLIKGRPQTSRAKVTGAFLVRMIKPLLTSAKSLESRILNRGHLSGLFGENLKLIKTLKIRFFELLKYIPNDISTYQEIYLKILEDIQKFHGLIENLERNKIVLGKGELLNDGDNHLNKALTQLKYSVESSINNLRRPSGELHSKLGKSKPVRDRKKAKSRTCTKKTSGAMRVKATLYIPRRNGKRKDHDPPPPPPPNKKRKFRISPIRPLAVSQKKHFYFSLNGPSNLVRENHVIENTNFELIFNYSVPPLNTLVQLKGQELNNLRKSSQKMELTIIPFGFIVTDEVYSRTAVFQNGNLVEPLIFNLQARGLRDNNGLNGIGVNDTGVLVLFRRNGAVLYEFFLEIKIVAANQIELKPEVLVKNKVIPDIKIEDLDEAKKRSREYAVEISSVGEPSYRIHRKIWKKENGREIVQNLGRIVSTLKPESLASLLGKISNRITSIAEHKVFNMKEYHSLDPYRDQETHSSLKECINILATEGWNLYDALSKDVGFKQILREIDGLRPGARVSIQTVDCFIPWGILYPSEFNLEWKNGNADPTKFWGYRYLIEVLLVGPFGNYQPDPIYKKAFVSLNVNSLLEEELLDDPKRGLTTHSNFFKESITSNRGELRRDPQRIKALFHTEQTKATFIYLYCHGSNEKAFDDHQTEILEFGSEGEEAGRMYPRTIRDSHILKERPLIFLNSCSSGAFSPLSITNFLTKFKGIGAEGLIVSEFPVPIRFGASFGQQIIRHYLEGRAIGNALMEIRRRSLKRLNPLGLFYSIHCPIDLRTQTKKRKEIMA